MGVAFEFAQILNDLETILGFEQQQAQQATLDTVFQQGQATLSLLQQVNTTLLAGLTTVESNQARIIGLLNQVISSIPGTYGTGPPVTLPPVPPPGYSSLTGSDVWDFPLPPPAVSTAGETLAGAFIAARNMGGAVGMFPATETRHVWAFGENVVQVDMSAIFTPINDDLGLAVPGDTPLTWITRLNPGQAWSLSAEGQTILTAFAAGNNSGGLLEYVLTVDQAAIDVVTRAAPAPVAPVWPGLARVTLGAAVPLADGLVVAGPLDGVIVNIATVPVPIGFYPFGSYKSYVRVGGVIFVDDNGEAEASQGIGGQDQIICPRSMQSATSAILRVKTGCTGTVTPWTAT